MTDKMFRTFRVKITNNKTGETSTFYGRHVTPAEAISSALTRYEDTTPIEKLSNDYTVSTECIYDPEFDKIVTVF